MDDSRRQGPRVQCDARFRGGGASENLAGTVSDLSSTGLFLHSRVTIPVGEQLHLEFELPTGKVQAVGEVRWVATGPTAQDRGLGIRFVRLPAADVKKIDDAVAELRARATLGLLPPPTPEPVEPA